MKITAVAYGLAFLLLPFFVHSLAEPEIGERKSFTTANVQHVRVMVVMENARDLKNEHRLLQSDTCSNGLSGVESNGVCCVLECGTCGGRGCGSRASSAGLTVNDCCPSRILDSGLYCSSEGVAPCIIEEEDPTPSPLPSPSPAPIPSSTGTLPSSSTPSDMQALLDLHNEARCMHNADPLVYSEEVEATAQAYAAVLAADCGTLEHSEAEDRNFYGENLYLCWGSTDCYTPEDAMYLLYDDEVQADSVLEYGGHATQILWKATTELGCAVESCTLDNVPYTYLVCHYNPAGNVIGQTEEEVDLQSGASC